MGSLAADDVAAAVADGSLIHCVIPCNELIVSGVSNWGAWALVAACALVSPSSGPSARRALGPGRNRAELSVDGLPWDDHATVLDDLVGQLDRKVR